MLCFVGPNPSLPPMEVSVASSSKSEHNSTINVWTEPHVEMFAMNSENPQLFIDYMRVKYPNLATHVCEHGQRAELSAAGKAVRQA